MAQFAIQSAASLFNFVQGNSQASSAAEAIAAGTNAQMSQAQQQYDQINAEATDKMSARAVEARREAARLRVIAAESGLQDNTGRSEQDVMFQMGADIAALEGTRQRQLKQAHEQAKGIAAQGQSRINQVRSQAPSLIGTGLQIAGAGIQYETRKDQLRQARTYPKAQTYNGD